AGGLRTRRGLRSRSPPVPARERRTGVAHLAVGELVGDLLEKAARHVPVAPPEQRALPRVGHVELALRARDPHVAEPPLLVEVARLDRAHVREDALLAADHEDDRELEALGIVE